MCKFESSQKDESGAKQADSSEAGHKATACFIIVLKRRHPDIYIIVEYRDGIVFPNP